MQKRKTFYEVTILNAVLCMGVVIIHLTFAPLVELRQKSLWQFLIFAVNKLLCFCVPSFIFLSGFKLFNKYSHNDVCVIPFYINRLKKIVLPYIVAVLVYFLYFYIKKWVYLKDLGEYLVLGTLSAHFYYIVISVQLYLLFPLILRLYKKSPVIVTALSLILTIISQCYFKFRYQDRIFTSYIFYFVFGMCFERFKLYEWIKKYILMFVAGVLMSGVCHIGGMYLSYLGVFSYELGNFINIIYVTFAMCVLYWLCSYLKNSKIIVKVSNAISKKSYFVYLYHCLLISIMNYEVFSRRQLSIRNEFLTMSAVMFAIIIIYCFGIKPNPKNKI